MMSANVLGMRLPCRLSRCQPLMSLEHAVPVQRGQDSRFQLPGQTSGLCAVVEPRREAGRYLASVAELGQHNLAALNGEGTGAITIVLPAWAPAGKCVTDVLRYNRCLLASCCHSLGVSGIGAVSQTPDVLVSHLPQCGRNHCQPTVGVGQ